MTLVSLSCFCNWFILNNFFFFHRTSKTSNVYDSLIQNFQFYSFAFLSYLKHTLKIFQNLNNTIFCVDLVYYLIHLLISKQANLKASPFQNKPKNLRLNQLGENRSLNLLLVTKNKWSILVNTINIKLFL